MKQKRRFMAWSEGDAVDRAVRDPKFGKLARNFAQFYLDVTNEIRWAETGHEFAHNPNTRMPYTQCVSTERIVDPACQSYHPGYLRAWFKLKHYAVQLTFFGQGVARVTGVKGWTAISEQGLNTTVGVVAKEDLEAIGFHEYRVGNVLFWEALALCHETAHPLLCPICRDSKVRHDGKTCGHENGPVRLGMH